MILMIYGAKIDYFFLISKIFCTFAANFTENECIFIQLTYITNLKTKKIMKKIYLLMAAMTAVVLVNASTTISLNNLSATGANESGICVTTDAGTNTQSSPVINTTNGATLRLYAGNTITIDAGDVEIESVVLNLNASNRNRLTTMEATNGTVVVDSMTWTATWSDLSGSNSAVTLTVGQKATLGIQSNNAGQIHILSIDVTLAGEEGTCEPPKADTVVLNIDTVIIDPEYYDYYGDVMFYVIDTTSGVELIFDAYTTAADEYDGTYSTEDESIDADYSGAYGAGATDPASAVEATLTISTSGETITMSGTMLSEDNIYYTFSYTGGYGVIEIEDDSYMYEPDEVIEIDEEFSELKADTDYVEDYGTLDIYLYKDESFVYLEYITSEVPEDLNMPLAAGEYMIDDSGAAGTFSASAGWSSTYEYDFPSFYGIYDEGGAAEGYYEDTYYFVDGKVTVTKEDGIYTIVVNATSAKGSTFTGTYTYEYDEDTAVEDIESKVINNNKIYNVMGMEVNKEHKGAVLIQNGKKFIVR